MFPSADTAGLGPTMMLSFSGEDTLEPWGLDPRRCPALMVRSAGSSAAVESRPRAAAPLGAWGSLQWGAPEPGRAGEGAVLETPAGPELAKGDSAGAAANEELAEPPHQRLPLFLEKQAQPPTCPRPPQNQSKAQLRGWGWGCEGLRLCSQQAEEPVPPERCKGALVDTLPSPLSIPARAPLQKPLLGQKGARPSPAPRVQMPLPPPPRPVEPHGQNVRGCRRADC